MAAIRQHPILTMVLLCLQLLIGSVYSVYAVEMPGQEEQTEEADREDGRAGGRKAGRNIVQKWKDMIDMVEDTFIGPGYNEKKHIDGIKDLDPYEQLGDITFSGGKGMKEAKEISASFYQLVRTVSVVGLVLSFVVGGICLAWSRSRNKADVEAAVAVKTLAFMAVFSLTGLWGILLPILKMFS